MYESYIPPIVWHIFYSSADLLVFLMLLRFRASGAFQRALNKPSACNGHMRGITEPAAN